MCGAVTNKAAAKNLKEITPIEKSYLDTPYYNQMARDALKNKPARFDFMKFRIFYARTRQYDPIGEETLKAVKSN